MFYTTLNYYVKNPTFIMRLIWSLSIWKSHVCIRNLLVLMFEIGRENRVQQNKWQVNEWSLLTMNKTSILQYIGKKSVCYCAIFLWYSLRNFSSRKWCILFFDCLIIFVRCCLWFSVLLFFSQKNHKPKMELQILFKRMKLCYGNIKNFLTKSFGANSKDNWKIFKG